MQGCFPSGWTPPVGWGAYAPLFVRKRNGGFWNGLFMTPYLLVIFLWRDTDYANEKQTPLPAPWMSKPDYR